MRVSLFGLFLRCTSLMGPWPKRIQSILLISALPWIPVLWLCHTRSYILPLCSNPHVFCTWHSYSSWLATWHCIILAWGVSLTPLDSHVQVMELGAGGFILQLIRVRSSSVDPQLTFQSSILLGPLVSLSSSLYKLVSAFILFYSCTFPCIPAFAHISDIIFM